MHKSRKPECFPRKKQNSGQLCVSPNHIFIPKRVLDLLASSKGQKILGGGYNEDKIELTVLGDVPTDDPLVKE